MVAYVYRTSLCIEKLCITITLKTQVNEFPERHNGVANYVFADGHATWLDGNTAFPVAVSPNSVTTAERKKAYDATAKYFAYDAAKRTWFISNAR